MKRQKPHPKGQSLVETAIIIPVVLLLVFGIIDFGLLFNNYILITNASREGARLAALGGSDAEVVEAVRDMTSTLDMSGLSVVITPNYSMRSRGSQVRVTVTYKARLVTPIISRFFTGGTARLQAESAMRVE